MAVPAPTKALRVLLVTSMSGLEAQLRKRSPPGVAWLRTKTDPDTAQALAQAEVVVADPPLVAYHLEGAPHLKWLQATYAGVDSLLRAGAPRDFVLTRVEGAFGPMMAEYTLGHILARERHLLGLSRWQESHQWQPSGYRVLSDLTLGLLGVGSIGQAVAAVARGFGMTVWGFRRGSGTVPNVDRVFTPDQLAEFLAGADYLVNILPSTPATRGLLSGQVLKACLPGTVFINMGRGDVVDEHSLVQALEAGWLAGAVLDVFDAEPLPKDSPLWDLPGVTITPHVAALGAAGAIAEIVAANLARYLAGEPLRQVVDWERGY